MDKLKLKDVTLVCIDDVNLKTVNEIANGICKFIDFTDVKIFASKDEPFVTNKMKPMVNLVDYSLFIVKELHKHIDTEFVMLVQTDGYPLNTQAWTDDFYRYDYIGAPWTWVPWNSREKICPTGRCVGNGGFSLRTKKILEEASRHDYNPRDEKLVSLHSGIGTEVEEDSFICRVIGEELKSVGIKFAPCELAHYFSVENKIYTGQFGFHGRETLKINKKFNVFGFKEHAYENMD